MYRFTYSIKGLFVAASGEIQERDGHVLEVNLSLGYPRRAPQCRMLTPVFHPNFDDATVCIGDFWAASEPLDELLLRVGRMIAYQEYNTKSPLNGLAAKWAAQNQHLLPVDQREIAPPADLAVQAVEDSANGTQPIRKAAAATAPDSRDHQRQQVRMLGPKRSQFHRHRRSAGPKLMFSRISNLDGLPVRFWQQEGIRIECSHLAKKARETDSNPGASKAIM